MQSRLARLLLIAWLLLLPASVFAAGPLEVSYTLSSGETVHGLLYEPAGHGKSAFATTGRPKRLFAPRIRTRAQKRRTS